MTQDFSRQRANMVESQVRVNDVTDLAVQDAMREVPRERFCGGRTATAYSEVSVEYAPGWRLAEPRTTAKLLQVIFPRPKERVLAIAAPYAAAVLAAIGCEVTALQPEGAVAEAVSEALAAAGVRLKPGDVADPGQLDVFDVIVCEGAVERAPQAWLDHLAEGGRLGVVERHGPGGRARLYYRGEDGGVSRRDVFDAPAELMPGFAPKAAFAL